MSLVLSICLLSVPHDSPRKKNPWWELGSRSIAGGVLFVRSYLLVLSDVDRLIYLYVLDGTKLLIVFHLVRSQLSSLSVCPSKGVLLSLSRLDRSLFNVTVWSAWIIHLVHCGNNFLKYDCSKITLVFLLRLLYSISHFSSCLMHEKNFGTYVFYTVLLVNHVKFVYWDHKKIWKLC